MEQFVGLDVSLNETSVCVVTEAGKAVWKGKCASTPEAIAETLRRHAPQAVRIGLESGPLSTWHWHALRDLGLPVVCLDARQVKAALSLQINKTDANDAHGLAQVVRTGWFRAVEVKSLDSHLARAQLMARTQLVAMRRDVVNQMRGILKTFGLILGKVGGAALPARVRELTTGQAGVAVVTEALLAVWQRLTEQIEVLDRTVLRQARDNLVCRRLMTIPGIGPITALSFTTVIDDPARFAKSSSVGAYLGLTPRQYQSGEVDWAGRISKAGDKLTRGYLFEAAGTLLTRVEKWCALKAWGVRLAKRIGLKKAKVAVARKLAVLMHRLWVDGSEFRWAGQEVAA
ncbi:IS110 family RNA-guided transposase [Azospirillum canadense]|uniref:IS110 family transposase n=1 Tax=Azospirillum canadense TaxID=403962 RepID=UPI00222740EC|nr:IS110 family transposase [Azospirillum canadense]MCW2239269.1 transposase [Azospirillum canadense]MCW2241603.1 transposase [Azospirillum canadense]